MIWRLSPTARSLVDKLGIDSRRMTEPAIRRRLALAHVVMLACPPGDSAIILVGAPIFRECERGRIAEFRPVRVVVLTVESPERDLFLVGLFVRAVRDGAEALERYGMQGPPPRGLVEDAT